MLLAFYSVFYSAFYFLLCRPFWLGDRLLVSHSVKMICNVSERLHEGNQQSHQQRLDNPSLGKRERHNRRDLKEGEMEEVGGIAAPAEKNGGRDRIFTRSSSSLGLLRKQLSTVSQQRFQQQRLRSSRRRHMERVRKSRSQQQEFPPPSALIHDDEDVAEAYQGKDELRRLSVQGIAKALVADGIQTEEWPLQHDTGNGREVDTPKHEGRSLLRQVHPNESWRYKPVVDQKQLGVLVSLMTQQRQAQNQARSQQTQVGSIWALHTGPLHCPGAGLRQNRSKMQLKITCPCRRLSSRPEPQPAEPSCSKGFLILPRILPSWLLMPHSSSRAGDVWHGKIQEKKNRVI